MLGPPTANSFLCTIVVIVAVRNGREDKGRGKKRYQNTKYPKKSICVSQTICSNHVSITAYDDRRFEGFHVYLVNAKNIFWFICTCGAHSYSIVRKNKEKRFISICVCVYVKPVQSLDRDKICRPIHPISIETFRKRQKINLHFI